MIVPLLLIAVLTPHAAGDLPVGTSDPCERLAFIEQERVIAPPLTYIERAAIEADERCIPLLLEWLTDDQPDDRRRRAAHILPYIGGDAATDALRSLAEDRGEFEMDAARAAADRGRPDDIEFLVSALRRGIGTAALSLGILRAREGREALQEVARASSISGSHARRALEWIDLPPCFRSGRFLSDDAMIALVFDCIGATGTAFERAARRVRVRVSGDSVTRFTGVEAHRSPDGRSAVVAVAGDTMGFRYVLRLDEEQGGWRVTQAWMRWIVATR